jgi:hypothetical protein
MSSLGLTHTSCPVTGLNVAYRNLCLRILGGLSHRMSHTLQPFPCVSFHPEYGAYSPRSIKWRNRKEGREVEGFPRLGKLVGKQAWSSGIPSPLQPHLMPNLKTQCFNKTRIRVELFDFLAVDRTGCDACCRRWLGSEPMANPNVCQTRYPTDQFCHWFRTAHAIGFFCPHPIA